MTLLDALRVRRSQGRQYIADPLTAMPQGFRGRPRLAAGACGDGCDACVTACPTAAIAAAPLALDLGRCTLCGLCAEACPDGRIGFTAEPRMAATTPVGLIVRPGDAPTPVPEDGALARLFGRSLRLRQVSAGGCNACELELNAAANVNFDVQRYGVEWVASPRHADGLVVTGPLTRAMAAATRLAWDAMPAPRVLVAVGACAISGGLYAGSDALDRALLDDVTPTLYVPGCPPHPLTFVVALLELLGRARP